MTPSGIEPATVGLK